MEMEADINAEQFNVQEFIKNARAKVKAILKQFNWTEESILQIKQNKEEEQEEERVDEDDPLFPESLPTERSITLDNKALSTLLKKNVEVPQKFSDLQVNFTRAEKLLIYQHVIEKIPSKISEDTSLLFEQEKEFAEMVATIKREKKKRRKYRTMKPTYMEELRAVVEMQMQALERCQQTKERKRRRSRSRSPKQSRKRKFERRRK